MLCGHGLFHQPIICISDFMNMYINVKLANTLGAALKVISFRLSALRSSHSLSPKSHIKIEACAHADCAGVAIFHFASCAAIVASQSPRRPQYRPTYKIAAIIIICRRLFLLYGPLFSAVARLYNWTMCVITSLCFFRAKPMPTIRTDYKLFLTAVVFLRNVTPVANFAC